MAVAAVVAPLAVLGSVLSTPVGRAEAAAPAADVDTWLVDPGVLVDDSAPPVPGTDAAAWLVADLDADAVLAARSAREPLPPASTLKLLTLLALAPGLDPDAEHTATRQDAAVEGSRAGLVPGSVYTTRDLLHGLVLSSGNDAAAALARAAGGTGPATSVMQRVADGLGATGTVVRTTSGLDADGQTSTAADLALVGRAALADETAAALVATDRYDFPGAGTAVGPGRQTYEIATKNRLLDDYDGALGLKTGFTRAAGGSFVGAAERDGRRYLVTLLGTRSDPQPQARALLDWAFAAGDAVDPVAPLDPSGVRTVGVAAALTTHPAGAATSRTGEGAVEEAAGPLGVALRTLAWTVAVLAVVVVLLRARVLVRRNRRRRRAAAAPRPG